jgi:hypothetical protein
MLEAYVILRGGIRRGATAASICAPPAGAIVTPAALPSLTYTHPDA